MAVELGKFISEQLKILPINHQDRKFLESKLIEVNSWESSKLAFVSIMEREEVGIAIAKINIEKLVVVKNQKRGGCTPKILEQNERFKKHLNEINGEQSVVNLLPTNFVSFYHIMDSLIENEIKTKQELINVSSAHLRLLPKVGPVAIEFIEAMRDLAIAESKAQSLNNPKA